MLSTRILLAVALSWLVAAAPKPKTREYDMDVTWAPYAPVGTTRNMFLINGVSPGPVIEVNEGEWVVVNLHNSSPLNMTLHFHGIEQYGTPWSDGVPGVTQRPVQPGSSFTYKWRATQHGSYWYHAHFRGQIEDGLFGGIVIHPAAPSEERPFGLISDDVAEVKAMEKAEMDVRPLVLSDLSQLESEEKWKFALDVGFEDTCYDAMLFNGKGNVVCLTPEEMEGAKSPTMETYLGFVPNATLSDKGCLPASVLNVISGGVGNLTAVPKGVYEGCTPTSFPNEVITVTSSCARRKSWVALDLVTATNFITASISIDEHDMWVYAMDGSYIKPQRVQGIVLSPGDRYSVLVKAERAGKFSIRANSVTPLQLMNSRATLDVQTPGKKDSGPEEGESIPWVGVGGLPAGPGVAFFNPAVAAPFPEVSIPESADVLFQLDMTVADKAYLWALNNTSLNPESYETSAPLLFAPNPNLMDNVTITTQSGQWVDLVFNVVFFPQPPHPIHKHGNKMYMIGSGTGLWRWESVDEARKEVPEAFNLVDPPRRDSFTSQEAAVDSAWTVVRYQVDNPGAWLLHCHIQSHAMGGMSMRIQDGIDQWPEIPEEYLNYE